MTDLRAATQLELQTYQRVLQTSLLSPAARTTIARLQGNVEAHARALAPLVNAPDRLAHTQLRSEEDCLRLLTAAADISIGACYAALERLTDPGAVRKTIEVMASEAQQRAVLGELLHPGDIKKVLPGSRLIGVG